MGRRRDCPWTKNTATNYCGELDTRRTPLGSGTSGAPGWGANADLSGLSQSFGFYLSPGLPDPTLKLTQEIDAYDMRRAIKF
jgi:hypothetical protein